MKGPMRHDMTIELITQLNDLIKCADGSKRTKLHRLIKNLIAKATTADDVLDKDGNIIKEGTGDLSVIQEIINRLEGKPSQKIVGADNGPVRVEYKTIEELRMFLLERGIDSLRVPPPPLRLVNTEGGYRDCPMQDVMAITKRMISRQARGNPRSICDARPWHPSAKALYEADHTDLMCFGLG
jgi:hypothetical protein